MKTTHTIDATGKTLGRLASEIATILRGKNSPNFERNIAPDVAVHVTNAAKLKTDPKKLKETIYTWYSGHPGGQYRESMLDMSKRKGFKELVIRAVKGMIPNNRLKAVIMKKLTVED